MEVNPFQQNNRIYQEPPYPFQFPIGIPEHDNFLNYHPENFLPLCPRCFRKNKELKLQKVVDISYDSNLEPKLKLQPSEQFCYEVKVQQQNKNQGQEGSNRKLSTNNTKVPEVRFVQKQGRNCNSNILRSFFRLLNSITEERTYMIQNIIKKRKLKIKVDQFCSWSDSLGVDVNKYIRISSIKHLFQSQKTYKEHSLVLRILLNDFLKSQAIPCFLTSKKAKRGIVSHTLISIRYLMYAIKEKRRNLRKMELLE